MVMSSMIRFISMLTLYVSRYFRKKPLQALKEKFTMTYEKRESYMVAPSHPRSLHPQDMNCMKIYPEGSAKICGTNSKRIWRRFLKAHSTSCRKNP